MSNDPNDPTAPKFDPASKERLNTEMKAAEQTLDEIARRPVERYQEASATISRFPPPTAMASIVLSVILVLCALPYASSWNANLWKGWKETVAQAKTADEIRGFETGRNWLPPVVLVPLALVAIGMGLHSRRHRLGATALCIGSLALMETLGAAAFYEWRDGSRRETFAHAWTVNQAEEAERARKQQEAIRIEQEKAAKEAAKKAEEKRLEVEAALARTRAVAEEAARERARAAIDASFREQQERQQQEVERMEAEKRRLAEEAEATRLAELNRQLAELERRRLESERNLEQIEKDLDRLGALRDKQTQAIEEQEQLIAGFLETQEKNTRQMKVLAERQDELASTIRAANLSIKRACDHRAEVQKQTKAANYKEALAHAVEYENMARDRKNIATKDLRETEAQSRDLQRQNDLATAGIKRAEAATKKLMADREALENQLATLETARNEAEETIADLSEQEEKLNTKRPQNNENP